MKKLTVSTIVNAPLATVWESFWKSEHIVHWNFAQEDWYCPKSLPGEPAVGATFCNTMAARDGSFQFDFSARYDIVEPMKRVVYTMGEMKEYFLDAGRTVEVLFEETWNGIRLTEIFDAEDIHTEKQQIAGWSAIFENFRKYTESL